MGKVDIGDAPAPITNTPIREISLKDFLRAFYQDDKKTVYLRVFDDRDSSDNTDKYRKNYEVELRFFDGIMATLQGENMQNHGVFFVVNGGGQKKEKVIASKSCSAQFMEIDEDENGNHVSFDEQLKEINAFPLRPSIIVRTRKSLHCYWLLKDGDIKRYRGIQEKLIKRFHSDPKIKDENRVMRLPYFNHCKSDPVRVELIHFEPDRRYTQDELEAVLPEMVVQDKEPTLEQQREPTSIITAYKMQKSAEWLDRWLELYDIGAEKKYCNNPHNGKALIKYNLTDGCPWKENHTVHSTDNSYGNAILSINHEGVIGFSCAHSHCADKHWKDFRLLYEPGAYIRASDSEQWQRTNSIIELLKMIKPEIRYSWNDKGNGSLFAEIFKDRVRWNVTAKEWFYYDKRIWKMDEGGMIASICAKELADALLRYSLDIEDENIKPKYQQFVVNLGKLRYRKTMLEDAKDKYFISSDMLDKGEYLLNLQNGVFDLMNFELLDHDPDLLLSKICNVSYDPEAKCERWEQFLNEVMEGSKEKIDYLQKILGYALTGDTKEETCYMLFGQTTRNGKSTLVETIGYMLGNTEGYALNMKPESLALKQNNDSRQASGDIARLKDCRFLNASEPPKRMIFDIGLLKTLLGRDSITARFLHQNEFQFIPCFKLFINTNFLPLITDDTLFSSGRINVITFNRHFSEQDQDKSLKDTLKQPEALSGILNWCIEGLKKYQSEGAIPPDAVKRATNDYRTSSDKVGNFIAEVLEAKPDHNLPAGIAYKSYQNWCTINGYGRENKTNFFAELRTKGIFASTGTINGRTVKNVIVGYDFAPDMLDMCLTTEYSGSESTDFTTTKNDSETPFN